MSEQTDIAMMKRDISDLLKQNEQQQSEIEEMKNQDTKRMRAAVVVLGGIVLSLVTYIWAVMIGDRV